ncbi:MAG: hypothetical protein ABIJ09_02410 [Pseudomonadota bacterium]
MDIGERLRASIAAGTPADLELQRAALDWITMLDRMCQRQSDDARQRRLQGDRARGEAARARAREEMAEWRDEARRLNDVRRECDEALAEVRRLRAAVDACARGEVARVREEVAEWQDEARRQYDVRRERDEALAEVRRLRAAVDACVAAEAETSPRWYLPCKNCGQVQHLAEDDDRDLVLCASCRKDVEARVKEMKGVVDCLVLAVAREQTR